MTSQNVGSFSHNTIANIFGGGENGLIATKNLACFSSFPNNPKSRRPLPDGWKLFSPHDGWPTRIKKPVAMLQMNRDGRDESGRVVSLIEQVANTIAKPVPGIEPSLAIGYPIALSISALLLPIDTAALIGVFFGLYAFLGRRLILEEYAAEQQSRKDDDEEEEDRPRTDLLALGAAIASAGLLSPDGFLKTSATVLVSDNTWILLGTLVGVGAVAWLLPPGKSHQGEEAEDETKDLPSVEREFMNLWDRKLKEEEDSSIE